MGNTKRVLLLTNIYNGETHFRTEIVDALLQEGYDVTYAAPTKGLKQEREEAGYHLVDIPFDRRSLNPLKDVRLLWQYVKLLRRTAPQVVLSFTIKPNLYGGMACRICKVPQIANVTGLGSAFEDEGWLHRLAIMLYRIGLRKTHMVFFQNTANMQYCEDHLMVRGQRKLLPGSGVNLIRFAYEEYPKEQPLRFLFLGRLIKQKGIDEYLEVARLVRKLHPEVEFHILGTCDEGYHDVLVNQPHEGIFYHGRQPDVRPFICQCHCLIHPSYYPEGMSNVLLESCATGRPIITTDRPGCKEVIEDGKNGFVVRPQDVDDLKEKVLKFISLPHEAKRQMGLAARQKVEREFDRQVVVKAYLDAIEEVEVRNER